MINIDDTEDVYYEDVIKKVKEIKDIVDKDHTILTEQFKSKTKISQRIIQWILNVFGTVYVLIERFIEYPNDDVILGMNIDEDLQTMSRKNLCRYMDAVLPERGFFDIQSTSKIRLGCQLLREYKELKKGKSKQPTVSAETGAYGDVDF